MRGVRQVLSCVGVKQWIVLSVHVFYSPSCYTLPYVCETISGFCLCSSPSCLSSLLHVYSATHNQCSDHTSVHCPSCGRQSMPSCNCSGTREVICFSDFREFTWFLFRRTMFHSRAITHLSKLCLFCVAMGFNILAWQTCTDRYWKGFPGSMLMTSRNHAHVLIYYE